MASIKNARKKEQVRKISLDDLRNHVKLTGLTQKEIGRRIERKQYQVSRIICGKFGNNEDRKRIMAIPLNIALVVYVKNPSINSHELIITDNSVNFNGYFEKKVAVKNTVKKKGR